ncbi:MAG TPA: hypothetical protein VHK88_08235, partial [Aquihabitans sp.]|nr:hypothetical protein [Aquihabitans sp.]
ARGAADPEAAVREAVAAAVELDVRRLVELTPPGEMSVLHDYGPLLVADAEEARGDDFKGPEVQELELEVADGPDGTRVVSASSFELVHGDEDMTTTWAYDGSCTSIRTDYSEAYFDEFGDDYLPSGEDAFEVCEDDADELMISPIALTGLYAPGSMLRVVTEQHDGQWFVSPSRTILESAVGGLRSMTVEDVRRAAQFWRGAYWAAEPDEFWEACGIDRPGTDVSVEKGDEAYEACMEALPEDYEGPYGPYGSYGSYGDGSYGDGSYDDGVGFDDGSGEGAFDDPAGGCYGEGATPTTDAEVAACLRDLAERGEMPPEAVGEICFYEHADDDAALAACLRQLVEDGLGSEDLLAEACPLEHTDQAALETCLRDLAANGQLSPEGLRERLCDGVYGVIDDLEAGEVVDEEEWAARDEAYEACMAEPRPDLPLPEATVPGGASSTVPEPRTEPAPSSTTPATAPEPSLPPR